jgi:hypothetical protein
MRVGTPAVVLLCAVRRVNSGGLLLELNSALEFNEFSFSPRALHVTPGDDVLFRIQAKGSHHLDLIPLAAPNLPPAVVNIHEFECRFIRLSTQILAQCLGLRALRNGICPRGLLRTPSAAAIGRISPGKSARIVQKALQRKFCLVLRVDSKGHPISQQGQSGLFEPHQNSHSTESLSFPVDFTSA